MLLLQKFKMDAVELTTMEDVNQAVTRNTKDTVRSVLEITATEGVMFTRELAQSAEMVEAAGTGEFIFIHEPNFFKLKPKRNGNGDHRDIRDHDARRGRGW